MLDCTKYAVRRGFSITALPVTGYNHCGVGQTEFAVECLVTTNKLDSKGFVVDNGDYQKIAMDLLPSAPIKEKASTTIEQFWNNLLLSDKEEANLILMRSGYDAFVKHVSKKYETAYPPVIVKLMTISCETFAGMLVEAIYDKMIEDGWRPHSIEQIEVKVGPAGLDANARASWKNEAASCD